VPLSVAHRTPADPVGIAALAEAGADVFEVDVRLLRGRLLVTHFQPVLRGVPVLQRDNWRLRLGHPPAPTFAEVVAHVPESCEVMIDLKDDRGPLAVALAEALAAQAGDPERLHASSKHWGSLQVLQSRGWRTWRTADTPARLAELEVVGLQGAWAATVRHTLLRPPGVAERLVEQCGRVLAWTVNDPGTADGLLARGIAGITTDAPAVHRVVAGR
jgi:glycerophosphoryl diester phosphodiesterase